MSVLIGKKLNKVLNSELREGIIELHFWCPACDGAHFVYVDGTNRHGTGTPNWEWNGDGDKPSFHPSVNVGANDPAHRCHFWLKEGKLSYCGDSWHQYKNQTLDLPDWDDR